MVDGTSLARGTIWLIINGLVANAAVIFYFIPIAHLVPNVYDLGVITFITLINQLAVVLFSFSIPRASVRFISMARATESEREVTGLAYRFAQIGSICAICAGISLFTISGVISQIFYGSSVVTLYVQLLSIDIIPLVFAHFLKQPLLGSQEYRAVSLSEITQNIARYSLAAALFLVNGGLTGIIFGWIVGDLLGVIVAGYFSKALFKGERIIDIPLRNVFSFAAKLFGMNATDHIVQVIDRYALLLLAGSVALGLYSPAATAAGIALVIPWMVTSALFPHFTGLSSSSSEEYLKNSEIAASKWIFALFIPVSFGIAALAEPIVLIMGGVRYLEAAGALLICAIAVGLSSPSAIINAKLLGRGRVAPMIIGNVFAIISGVIASFLLIPQWTIIGAAFSRAIILLVFLIVTSTVLYINRELNLDSKAFLHSVTGSTIMLICVKIMQTLVSSILLVPIYIVSGAIIYGVYLRVSKILTKEDLVFLSNLLPMRLKPLMKVIGRLVVKD
ncbi:MAG: oligosaccharide flippase family protein [Candidatus Thorarchaeota archaeon]